MSWSDGPNCLLCLVAGRLSAPEALSALPAWTSSVNVIRGEDSDVTDVGLLCVLSVRCDGATVPPKPTFLVKLSKNERTPWLGLAAVHAGLAGYIGRLEATSEVRMLKVSKSPAPKTSIGAEESKFHEFALARL